MFQVGHLYTPRYHFELESFVRPGWYVRRIVFAHPGDLFLFLGGNKFMRMTDLKKYAINSDRLARPGEFRFSISSMLEEVS